MSTALAAVVLLACVFVVAYISLVRRLDDLLSEIKRVRDIHDGDFRMLADRIRSAEELTKSARDTARTNRVLADEKLDLLAGALGYSYDPGYSKPTFVKKGTA